MSPLSRLDMAFMELWTINNESKKQIAHVRRVRKKAEFGLFRIKAAIHAWKVRKVLEMTNGRR